jgi:hypothetical protein
LQCIDRSRVAANAKDHCKIKRKRPLSGGSKRRPRDKPLTNARTLELPCTAVFFLIVKITQPSQSHFALASNHDSSRISARRRIALVVRFECLAIARTVCPSAKLARNWLSSSVLHGSPDRDATCLLPASKVARATCCRSDHAELFSWIPNFATLRVIVPGNAPNLAAAASIVAPFEAIDIN